MLRRSIWELSSRGRASRIPTQITTQIPSYLSSRKNFSVSPQQNAPEGSESQRNLMPYFLGIIIGGAGYGAYRFGYFDDMLLQKVQHSADSANVGTFNKDSSDDIQLDKKTDVPNFQESTVSTIPSLDHPEDSKEPEPVLEKGPEPVLEKGPEPVLEKGPEPVLEKGPEPVLENNSNPVQEKEITSSPQNESAGFTTSEEKTPDLEHKVENIAVQKEDEEKSNLSEHLKTTDISEVTNGNDVNQPSSLLDDYLLKDSSSDSASDSSYGHKDLVEEMESEGLAYVADDGKLVLDFIQAIHTAEKRQAELDARVHSEEKRMIKEKYEKDLKDARARELMYAEREAILDKELNKEKVKAAAALKSLQEKLEEKLKMELEQKESEKELELKRTQELAKAELAAAIASEKASQIEKMAEANLDINALCMAFYARSEEARQSHSVHKLALGALALEEALSKGLPIQKEIDALQNYLQGLDKDSLLDLVLSSLPQETRTYGTDTLLQLNNKFDSLKGTLRHFVLIPPGGGGILTHSLAHVASLLKVREADQSGEGIESLINKVENLLAKGKILEAANTLEDGLKGSQAEQVVSDWVKQARNRAIAEQALTLIQSYATSISLT